MKLFEWAVTHVYDECELFCLFIGLIYSAERASAAPSTVLFRHNVIEVFGCLIHVKLE